MTILRCDEVTCCYCGQVSEQISMTSSNERGSRDLDFRPAEMYRSTMNSWLQECPHCHFISTSISTRLAGFETAAVAQVAVAAPVIRRSHSIPKSPAPIPRPACKACISVHKPHGNAHSLADKKRTAFIAPNSVISVLSHFCPTRAIPVFARFYVVSQKFFARSSFAKCPYPSENRLC